MGFNQLAWWGLLGGAVEAVTVALLRYDWIYKQARKWYVWLQVDPKSMASYFGGRVRNMKISSPRHHVRLRGRVFLPKQISLSRLIRRINQVVINQVVEEKHYSIADKAH